ncbi:MAG: cytochrome P450 [Ilumatobacteraceae bacterium]
MTTHESDTIVTDGCPVANYGDVNRRGASVSALWHFDNFDEHRERSPIWQGDANGHEFFMLTRMKDIRATFQNHAVFSNSSVSPEDPDPPYKWIPEMLDPPIHTKWRQLLGPLFSPAAIAALEPRVQARFDEIIDEIAGRGECEFVQDVALKFPNVIFMGLMGLPVSDADLFGEWETAILHGGRGTSQQGRLDAMNEVVQYFDALIAERRRNPQDDIVSRSLSWEIDGAKVTDEDLHAMCLLLFMAGLDTVAQQLTYSFFHLATHDDDRRRIVADPSLIPSATEEFLRYYSFVTPARKVMSDTEVRGCPMHAGHMVYLPLVSANRDTDEFDRADEVVIDRADNRHIAFGAGPHRCLGSHLARQELRIAFEGWHRRIPEYRLKPGVEIHEHGGQVGLDNLSLIWDV